MSSPMIEGARARVDVPLPAIATGGLLAAARVIDVSANALMGAEYETPACASVEQWEHWCISVPECGDVPTAVKNLASNPLEHVWGNPFAIYDGVECDFARMDWASEQASLRFDYGERRGVDLAVYARMEAAGPDEFGDGFDLVDLGGPFPLPEALGLAELLAGQLYGGTPILVVPLNLVACGCANGMFGRGVDGNLVTCGGSLVAAVVTADDVEAGITSTTMFVTGQITLLRGPKMQFSAPPGFDCDGNATPPRALVERLYVPLIECLVGKVEVTCS